MHRRRGMTLIEVVALILILLVLVALLLPAVSSAREPARRAQCTNNLKQLGLAVANYVESQGVFPPIGATSGADMPVKPRILPYFETSSLYNSLNWSLPHRDPANRTARAVELYWFLCPSDPAALLPPTGRSGRSNYPNNLGTYPANNEGRLDGPAYTLGDGSGPIRLDDVTDGAEHSAFFAETTLGRGPGDADRGAIFRANVADDAPADLPTLAASCEASTSVFSGLKGSDWLDPDAGRGGGYSHIMPPNAKSCVFRNRGFDPRSTMVGASSHHPGGANAAMIDGSVRFIKTTISPAAWRSLGTIAGAEVLGPGSY